MSSLGAPHPILESRLTPDPTPALPRNAVVLLLDSLNRHLIGPYGSTEFDTPNLDRLTRRSVRFDRHYSGPFRCATRA